MARATKRSRPVAASRKPVAAKRTGRTGGSKTVRPAKAKATPGRRAKPIVKTVAKPKPAPRAVAKTPKPPAKKQPAGRGPAQAGVKSPATAPVRQSQAAAAPAAPKVVPKPVVTPPEPPRKPRKPELTPKEIAAVKASLLEQRKIFSREFSDIEEGAFNISQSEMSGEVSFDEEYADAGSFTFEREKELSIGNNIRDLLDKVDHALNAIERGTYGICENCGQPIAKARLLALPYSTMCLKCKQQEERTR